MIIILKAFAVVVFFFLLASIFLLQAYIIYLYRLHRVWKTDREIRIHQSREFLGEVVGQRRSREFSLRAIVNGKRIVDTSYHRRRRLVRFGMTGRSFTRYPTPTPTSRRARNSGIQLENFQTEIEKTNKIKKKK